MKSLLVESCFILEVDMREALGLARVAVCVKTDFLTVALPEELMQLMGSNSESDVSHVCHMVPCCLHHKRAMSTCCIPDNEGKPLHLQIFTDHRNESIVRVLGSCSSPQKTGDPHLVEELATSCG